LGSRLSTSRTKYQAESARFWAQGANTSTINGQWLEIARQVRRGDKGWVCQWWVLGAVEGGGGDGATPAAE
jgi:hypothetical protein